MDLTIPILRSGFHTYDGHAGFVAAMLTVPLPPSPGDGATAAAPWSATHVITAGGDDRAIVQLVWKAKGCAGSWIQYFRHVRARFRVGLGEVVSI